MYSSVPAQQIRRIIVEENNKQYAYNYYLARYGHPMTATNVSPASTQGRSLHHQIVIDGGGAAGIAVAAQLMPRNSALDVLLLDPSAFHYYQPAWTIVGAGCYDDADTVKPGKNCIPNGVQWLQEGVATFDLEQNRLQTEGGTTPRPSRKRGCISFP